MQSFLLIVSAILRIYESAEARRVCIELSFLSQRRNMRLAKSNIMPHTVQVVSECAECVIVNKTALAFLCQVWVVKITYIVLILVKKVSHVNIAVFNNTIKIREQFSNYRVSTVQK
jgi:hypothetical protein